MCLVLGMDVLVGRFEAGDLHSIKNFEFLVWAQGWDVVWVWGAGGGRGGVRTV